MDIKKIADWANIGNFVLAGLALYVATRGQKAVAVDDGLSGQSFILVVAALVVSLLIAALLHLAAAIIQRTRRSNVSHKTIVIAYHRRP